MMVYQQFSLGLYNNYKIIIIIITKTLAEIVVHAERTSFGCINQPKLILVG